MASNKYPKKWNACFLQAFIFQVCTSKVLGCNQAKAGGGGKEFPTPIYPTTQFVLVPLYTGAYTGVTQKRLYLFVLQYFCDPIFCLIRKFRQICRLIGQVSCGHVCYLTHIYFSLNQYLFSNSSTPHVHEYLSYQLPSKFIVDSMTHSPHTQYPT